jgi:hypothetical protein
MTPRLHRKGTEVGGKACIVNQSWPKCGLVELYLRTGQGALVPHKKVAFAHWVDSTLVTKCLFTIRENDSEQRGQIQMEAETSSFYPAFGYLSGTAGPRGKSLVLAKNGL